MEESATYQAIVRRGRLEGARRFLLLSGGAKFGPADAAAHTTIESIDDITELEGLAVRILKVGSWQELLVRPAAPLRNSRRERRG